MDRLPLIISTLCFLLGFAATLSALRAGRYRPRRFNLAMMAAGFVLQTLFLYQRGRAFGHCPLTNLFEVFVFLSWSITLFYLVIGPAYRLSLLGMFTEPLVFLIQAVALLAPIDTPHRLAAVHSPWVEVHAALSVMAYGAFAMAAIAGVMYLAQDRQLKTHRLGTLFFQMPPITDLAIANVRLLWTGFLLLSAGLAAASMLRTPVTPLTLLWGSTMWVIYLALIFLARRGRPRRIAFLSGVVFLLAVAALCALNHFGMEATL